MSEDDYDPRSEDSHIVRPGNWFPICGQSPNDSVTLPLDRVRDSAVLDAANICPQCAQQAGNTPATKGK